MDSFEKEIETAGEREGEIYSVEGKLKALLTDALRVRKSVDRMSKLLFKILLVFSICHTFKLNDCKTLSDLFFDIKYKHTNQSISICSISKRNLKRPLC